VAARNGTLERITAALLAMPPAMLLPIRTAALIASVCVSVVARKAADSSSEGP
jgi:hypothetical protein